MHDSLASLALLSRLSPSLPSPVRLSSYVSNPSSLHPEESGSAREVADGVPSVAPAKGGGSSGGQGMVGGAERGLGAGQGSGVVGSWWGYMVSKLGL